MTEARFTSSAKDPSDALFAYRQQRLASLKDLAAALMKSSSYLVPGWMGLSHDKRLEMFAETWGCSRRNARDVVAAAHKDWLDACYGSEEIDQRDLLFQQGGRLERIARKAENAGQFSAAVGAITVLNRMMALGADQKGFSYRGSKYDRHPSFKEPR